MNKNTTLRTITILFVLGLLTTAGCQPMTSSKGQVADKPRAQEPAPAPSELNNFPGGYLVVKLDGNATQEGPKENHEQIWSGGVISSTPTILYTMDERALGAIKNASLVIQPTKNGKVVEGDIFQYADGRKLTPDAAIKLDRFSHVYESKLDTDLKALPAGTYRISLQVHGTKGWDRQRIDVRVK